MMELYMFIKINKNILVNYQDQILKDLIITKYNYVVRGGCFADESKMLRVSARDCNLSLNKSEKLGLRLVCDSSGQRDF